MKTAEEMFEELGYKFKDSKYQFCYSNGSDFISFSKDRKCYSTYENQEYHLDTITITPKLHLAIHQQMKELGWIE